MPKSGIFSAINDAARRLTNVTSLAGAFTYVLGGAAPSSPLVKELLLPNGAYITNVYDGNGRLTGTALENSGGTNIDAEAYVYNQGNQRTQQVFTAGNFMNYTYDGIGQLQTALGKEPGGVTNRLHEQFGYTYDAAGNLSRRTNNALETFFGVNNLNELTAVTHSGTLTVEGTTTSPATNVTVNTSNAVLYVDNTFASTNQPLVLSRTNVFTAMAQDSYGRVSTNVSQAYFTLHETPGYDLNGNMVSESTPLGRQFAYDDENQLIAVWVTNTWMSQFTYDGKMRRRIRREYNWQSATGTWQLTNEVHYIYDGNVVIQERDGNNLPQVTYMRGTDLSGSLQGAGGIGGLLARTANPLTINPQLSTSATVYYHSDGNGNITCLVNSNQSIVAKYEYDPYGNVLSQLGSLADANVYRFSSKEYDIASGLIYYLRRYYEPNLQRWITRDPLAELDSRNLYRPVWNNPIDSFDIDGRYTIDTIQDLEDMIKQEKQLYDAVSQMAKNASECKSGCYGILSAMAYYCVCIQDHWNDVNELASCMCVTAADDKACQNKIKAQFGVGIQIADSIAKAKEYFDKVKEFQDTVQEVKDKIDEFNHPKQKCCKK